MATDHRGRDVHAGKRTRQEIGWVTENPADYVDASSGDTDAYRDLDPIESYKEIGDSSLSVEEGRRRYTWRVRSPWALGDENLGKYKSYESTPESPYPGGSRTPAMSTISGTTRTLKRGQIAAEAMHNRLEEGRNPRTGRPTT